MADLDSLYQKLEAADKAGNTEDATMLAAWIREEEAAAQSAEPDPELEQKFADKFVRAVGFDDGPYADSNFEVANGIQRGLTNIGQGVQDLYGRVTGSDSLDQMNARFDKQQAQYDARFGESGWASGGEILGEVLGTLPAAGGIGLAAKGTGLLARTTALAATEGALVEGVVQRGDLAERAEAAAWGAGGGALGSEVLKAGGRVFRKNKLRGEVKGQFADAALAREAQGLPVAKNQAGLTAEGDARVLSARNDGGYELNRVDAERMGFNERENLFTSSDPDWALRQKVQTSDITKKAESFVPTYKVDGAGVRESAASVREQAGQELSAGLKAIRDADEVAVKQAYQAVSDSAGKDTVINVQGLRGNLQTHVEELLDGGDTATASGITRLLNRHVPEGGNITVKGMMDLRKGVTNLYKRGEDNTNRITGNFKEALDKSLMNSDLSAAGKETADLFKTATAKARENFVKWDGKGVKGKMTKMGIDPEAFAQDPVTTINKMLGKGELAQLKELERMVKLNPSLQGAWDKATNVPKLEALEAALSKEGEFSAKRYAASMKNLSPDKREVLFGKEGAEQIDKATRAWNLRGQEPDNIGKGNKSGTAGSAFAQGATLGAFSMAGIPLPFVAPIVRGIKSLVGVTQNASTIKALANNSLPPKAAKEAKRTLKASLAKEMGITDLEKYDKVLTMALRNTIREYTTSDGEQ